MTPVILFRKGLDEEGEFETCCSSFGGRVLEYRSDVRPGSTVVCRYSALPFYKELEEEIVRLGSQMINSYSGHRYIADMEWAFGDLATLTFKTWDNWVNLPEGSFVVKGKTNSRKFQWKTHMFAESREDVPKVAARLMDDSLVADQGLVVRQYVPLRTLGEGINGLPITNEWRFFVLDREILSAGFYWSILGENSPKDVPEKATEMVMSAVRRISHPGVRFVVVDVAESENGEWFVVELNDGQMSGLSNNDPAVLYRNLYERLS